MPLTGFHPWSALLRYFSDWFYNNRFCSLPLPASLPPSLTPPWLTFYYERGWRVGTPNPWRTACTALGCNGLHWFRPWAGYYYTTLVTVRAVFSTGLQPQTFIICTTFSSDRKSRHCSDDIVDLSVLTLLTTKYLHLDSWKSPRHHGAFFLVTTTPTQLCTLYST